MRAAACMRARCTALRAVGGRVGAGAAAAGQKQCCVTAARTASQPAALRQAGQPCALLTGTRPCSAPRGTPPWRRAARSAGTGSGGRAAPRLTPCARCRTQFGTPEGWGAQAATGSQVGSALLCPAQGRAARQPGGWAHCGVGGLQLSGGVCGNRAGWGAWRAAGCAGGGHVGGRQLLRARARRGVPHGRQSPPPLLQLRLVLLVCASPRGSTARTAGARSSPR